MGFQVRRNLLAATEGWDAGTLTLTVDRSEFANPREAYERVSGMKAVPRLMRGLGITQWVASLEFQMGDHAGAKPGGWRDGHEEWGAPHWHVLWDRRCRPGGWIDFKKGWYLWRDCWGLGGLDVRDDRKVKGNALYGVNYITAYLTKYPKKGFPDWVLRSSGIRFVSGCKGIGPLVRTRLNTSPIIGRRGGESVRAGRRSLADRVADCSSRITVMERKLDKSTGVLGWRWACTLRGEAGALAAIQQDGCRNDRGELVAHALPGVVEVRGRTVRMLPGASVAALCDRYGLMVERGSEVC